MLRRIIPRSTLVGFVFIIFTIITTINRRRAKIDFLTIWSSLKVTRKYGFKGTQPSYIKHMYSLAITCASVAIGVFFHWSVLVSGGRRRISNFLGVGLPLTIYAQQSTNILLPVVQELLVIFYGKNTYRSVLIDDTIGLLPTLNNPPQNTCVWHHPAYSTYAWSVLSSLFYLPGS